VRLWLHCDLAAASQDARHRALDFRRVPRWNSRFSIKAGSNWAMLFRLIAVFDLTDSGRIAIGGERVERVPVEQRRSGMVF
jgi:ABC-type thiamine transport system ATPase subunit